MRGKAWTPQEDAELCRMVEAGVTRADMVRATGRTVDSVAVRVKGLRSRGVLPRGPRAPRSKYRASCYLSLAENSKLEVLARRSGTSVSGVVRAAVLSRLEDGSSRTLAELVTQARELREENSRLHRILDTVQRAAARR